MEKSHAVIETKLLSTFREKQYACTIIMTFVGMTQKCPTLSREA